MGYVDYGTGKYDGDLTVHGCLSKDSMFWIVWRVVDDVKEKSMAKILVCFGERTL